jgi:hypothetical protein
VLVALVLVALGAGVAVAASTTDYPKTVTVIERNGETHEGVVCGEVVHDEDGTPKVVRGLQPDECRDFIQSIGGSQRRESEQLKDRAP